MIFNNELIIPKDMDFDDNQHLKLNEAKTKFGRTSVKFLENVKTKIGKHAYRYFDEQRTSSMEKLDKRIEFKKPVKPKKSMENDKNDKDIGEVL
jgi:hypothetical protein